MTDRDVHVNFEPAMNGDTDYFVHVGDEVIGPLTEGELQSLGGCAKVAVGLPD